MWEIALGIALVTLAGCAPTHINTACGLATSWDDCAPVRTQSAYNPAAAAAAMQLMQMNNANFNAQQQRQVDIFRAGVSNPYAQQPIRLQTTCMRAGNMLSCN